MMNCDGFQRNMHFTRIVLGLPGIDVRLAREPREFAAVEDISCQAVCLPCASHRLSVIFVKTS
jgi:hypothetical protein